MIALHPDEYLDLRLPEWRRAETIGRIVYNTERRIVEVRDDMIEAALRMFLRG